MDVHIGSQRALPRRARRVGTLPVNMKQRPLEVPQFTFAERLKAAMKQRGVTAPGLETRGIATRQWIYKLLKGKTEQPDIGLILDLCEELMIRPEWLMREKGPMIPAPALTDEESTLVYAFRAMDDRGKRQLMRIATAISQDADGVASRSDPFKKGGK